MDAFDPRFALAAAADALAARLRAGTLPRASRAAARALLTRAFEAQEAPAAAPAPLLALLRAIDALLSPCPPFATAPVRIGQRWLRGAVDAALVDRIAAYGALAERLSARIDAFVAATGGEPLRLFVAEVRPGEREAPDWTFTQG